MNHQIEAIIVFIFNREAKVKKKVRKVLKTDLLKSALLSLLRILKNTMPLKT